MVINETQRDMGLTAYKQATQNFQDDCLQVQPAMAAQVATKQKEAEPVLQAQRWRRGRTVLSCCLHHPLTIPGQAKNEDRKDR